jgi:hypothetical protein
LRELRKKNFNLLGNWPDSHADTGALERRVRWQIGKIGQNGAVCFGKMSCLGRERKEIIAAVMFADPFYECCLSQRA